MKMNKKLIVPFLATVVGLSISGGLGGAFAWYQFNSQVRTAFIGKSVANGELFQIGYVDPNDSSKMIWGRDHTLVGVKDLIPVTFDQVNGNSLPTTAYGRPVSGKQLDNGYGTGWQEIANGDGYYQYDIYFRTLVSDPSAAGDSSQDIAPGYKLVANKKVFMTKMTLEDASHPDGSEHEIADDSYIANALRVHLNVAGEGGAKHLISKNGVSNLNLYGELDLDGDKHPDTYDVDPWNSKYGQVLTYGHNEHKQTAESISDVVKTDSDTDPDSKLICKTLDGTTMAKVTITVYLEGWASLKVGSSSTSNMWNPALNSGMQLHIGMIFDAE